MSPQTPGVGREKERREPGPALFPGFALSCSCQLYKLIKNN